MARAHGPGRGTGYQRGELSGATITTFPSGTTISKNAIQTGGGVTAAGEVRGSQFYDTTTSGYPISYGTAAFIIGAGTCAAATGECTPSAAAMGLSTITAVVASASTAEANITPMFVTFDRGGGAEWHSSATQVCFHVYAGAQAGASGKNLVGGVSVHYIAIGQ